MCLYVYIYYVLYSREIFVNLVNHMHTQFVIPIVTTFWLEISMHQNFPCQNFVRVSQYIRTYKNQGCTRLLQPCTTKCQSFHIIVTVL